MPRPTLTMRQRFDRGFQIDVPEKCWIWGGIDRPGVYATLRRGGAGTTKVLIHRYAVEIATGQEVPDDLTVDHLCQTSLCVNPGHLEIVTNAENARRQMEYRARKIACLRGHWYDDENTEWNNGVRICRTCRRARIAQRQLVGVS